jgi:CysZ protein
LWIIIKIAFFIIFTYINGYLVLAILSPLLAIISEKTEKIVLGKKYPFSIQQLLHDILRGILIIFRNLFYELFLNILLLIATLIPVLGQIIGILSPFILFGISSYFYGFSFIDYNSERHKLSVKESVSYVRRNGGLALSNGGLFSLFLMIPILGSLIAGIIAIISTVAATLAVLEINQKNETSNN